LCQQLHPFLSLRQPAAQKRALKYLPQGAISAPFLMHINRDGLPGSVICFFYVKSISVKSRIVAIKKLFWITETGTYSPDLFPQRNYKVLDYKSLTLA
jgi:hypothetical protein